MSKVFIREKVDGGLIITCFVDSPPSLNGFFEADSKDTSAMDIDKSRIDKNGAIFLDNTIVTPSEIDSANKSNLISKLKGLGLSDTDIAQLT